jgi:hypothetical protein
LQIRQELKDIVKDDTRMKKGDSHADGLLDEVVLLEKIGGDFGWDKITSIRVLGKTE